jgi:hypothetical protein
MSETRSTVTIKTTNGKAFVREADGKLVALEAGDILMEGLVIVTPDGGRVELTFIDGSFLELGGNQAVQLTGPLFDFLGMSFDAGTFEDQSNILEASRMKEGFNFAELKSLNSEREADNHEIIGY